MNLRQDCLVNQFAIVLVRSSEQIPSVAPRIDLGGVS